MPDEKTSDNKKTDEKKIIVDEDWKAQARREKEQLAAEQQKQEQHKTEEPTQQTALPPGNFTTLVSMLLTQAYMALGAIRPKDTKDEDFKPDLEFARYHIDILSDLETKTKGNLEPEEAAMLHDALHTLRMLYVKMSG